MRKQPAEFVVFSLQTHSHTVVDAVVVFVSFKLIWENVIYEYKFFNLVNYYTKTKTKNKTHTHTLFLYYYALHSNRFVLFSMK